MAVIGLNKTTGNRSEPMGYKLNKSSHNLIFVSVYCMALHHPLGFTVKIIVGMMNEMKRMKRERAKAVKSL